MRDGPKATLALALAIAFAALIGAASADPPKPSFDCAKAGSVAEKMICADPALAAADAEIASHFSAALKKLDAPARKALAEDQQAFIYYRDRIAGFDQDIPKDKQNFPLDEFMRDRAAFLASVETPAAGFLGTWKNVQGEVTVKPAGPGKLEVGAELANPSTAGSVCDVGGIVKAGAELRLVDTDDNDKPTGFVFTFRRVGDSLAAVQSGSGKDDGNQPPSCGANGHVDGVFFLTRAK